MVSDAPWTLNPEDYRNLQIDEALNRNFDFAEAAEELSLLLRQVYRESMKEMQLLLYEDVVRAVSNMSRMETEKHLVAAHNLRRSAESVLPKRRREAVGRAFKQALLIRERRMKKISREATKNGNLRSCSRFFSPGSVTCDDQGEDESSSSLQVQLPHDCVSHVFSYLDTPSLVAASAVCKNWNVLATSDTLWKIHFCTTFGVPQNTQGIDWRAEFCKEQKRNPSRVRLSNRMYCVACHHFFWLFNNNVECTTVHSSSLKPSNAAKVCRILRRWQYDSSEESEGSEDDADYKVLKLWSIRMPT